MDGLQVGEAGAQAPRPSQALGGTERLPRLKVRLVEPPALGLRVRTPLPHGAIIRSFSALGVVAGAASSGSFAAQRNPRLESFGRQSYCLP